MKKIILILPLFLFAASCSQQSTSTQGTSSVTNNKTTSETRTYTNSKYNFQMQVPSDSKTVEAADSNSVAFEKDDVGIMAIVVTDTSKNLTDFTADYVNKLSGYTIQKADMTIAGQPALRLAYNISTKPNTVYSQKYYLFVANGHGYEINISPSILIDQADSLVKSFTFKN